MPTRHTRPSAMQQAFVVFVIAIVCAGGISSSAFAQVKVKSRPPATGKATLPGGMPLPPTLKPKPPQTLEQRFTDRNQRAQRAFQYSRCMMTTLVAGRSGKLGPVPANDLAVCVQQKGEWRGVFGQFDESKSGFAVRLQYSMNGNGTIVKSSVDTATVAGAARSLVRASSVQFPGDQSHEFLPVILQEPNFFEIWFLSAHMYPPNAIVGGDSLIQMSFDGRKELGHSVSTPRAREVQIAPGESYLLQSSEADIPTISELIVANAAANVVAQATVRTNNWDWVRTRTAPAWRRLPRSL